MADTLNGTEEARLLDSVKQAVSLVDSGMTPDDAIEKIARDEGYGPGRIGLVAHAYNNGRQLHQWNSGSANILDKLASFTLADPDKVIQKIYGAQKEKSAGATDPDYLLPPTWLESPILEKRARAPLPVKTAPATPYQKDPMESLHRAYGSVQREKQAAEEASRQASAAEDRVRNRVAQLVTYFKQANYNRMPFEHAEAAARSYFGNASIPLMNVVYQQARLREKRASAQLPVMNQALNIRAEPFTIIKEAIAAAEECCKLKVVANGRKENVGKVKEASLRPFLKAGALKPPAQQLSALTPGLPAAKAANIFQTKSAMGWGSEVAAIAAGDVIGQGIHTKLHEPGEGDSEAEEDPLLEDDDGSAQQEISGIRSRVALDSMLANPGNPLAKVPAPQVVAAYNQLIQQRPELAGNQAALQPLLEGRFAGRAKGVKSAMLDLGAGMAGVQFGRMLGNPVKPKEDLIEDRWLELEDPNHANELRKIKAHTLLTQLMTDPEDPISGHDPDKVLSAFNELSSASPRVADTIHTLRPALRRKLEGNQESFESKELLDIEKGLAASRMPTRNTSIMGESPEKLQG